MDSRNESLDARRRLRRSALTFGLSAVVCLGVSLATREARADDASDTVLLANGGRVRGTVMEEDPQKGTSIRLLDGTVKRVPAAEVKQVLYAGGNPASSSAAPPALPPALTAAAPMPAGIAPPSPGLLPAATTAPTERYRTETRGIRGLYITGPILLGATWLTTIAITAAATDTRDPNYGQKVGVSSIPVFGPWALLAQPQIGSGYVGPIVVSGVVQAAALTMTVAGVAVRREVKVPLLGRSSVSLVPTLGGAAAIGTF